MPGVCSHIRFGANRNLQHFHPPHSCRRRHPALLPRSERPTRRCRRLPRPCRPAGCRTGRPWAARRRLPGLPAQSAAPPAAASGPPGPSARCMRSPARALRNIIAGQLQQQVGAYAQIVSCLCILFVSSLYAFARSRPAQQLQRKLSISPVIVSHVMHRCTKEKPAEDPAHAEQKGRIQAMPQ